MIILFENILFLKEFFACNGCFGLFNTIKNESWTSFLCTFSAWFFHKNVPDLVLYQLTKFQCHTFFLPKKLNKMFYKFFFRQLMLSINFKTYLQSTSVATGKMEIQKNGYLEKEMSFWGEIKGIFHNYSRAITWWKNEK